MVIIAKNKELLLKIFCAPFLPLFGKIQPKFGHKFCRPNFFILRPLLSFCHLATLLILFLMLILWSRTSAPFFLTLQVMLRAPARLLSDAHGPADQGSGEKRVPHRALSRQNPQPRIRGITMAGMMMSRSIRPNAN